MCPRRHPRALAPRLGGALLALFALLSLPASNARAQTARPSPPPFPAPVLTWATLPRTGAPEVGANDNCRPAGRLAGGVLTVALEARTGVWRPEAADGPAIVVAAFGEPGAAPSTPGPLLRVPVGTDVRATVRNALPLPITVHGLDSARGPAGAGATIAPGARIAPGASRIFRFRADAPGLSYYVARTSPAPPLARLHDDAQLHGALVVDPPPGAAAPPPDRIFVISNHFTRDASTSSGLGRDATLAINGRSWPHTERIVMAQGDTARWRVVNASTLTHPMHLHGAYFRVDARGDGARDTLYAPGARRLAASGLLTPGQTMAIAWTPVHAGNWIFHCHFASHIAPREALDVPRPTPGPALRPVTRTPNESPSAPSHAAPHAAPPAASGHMAGLVVGVEVAPRGPQPRPRGPERAVRLVVRSRGAVYGPHAGYGFVLGGSPAEAASDSLPVPGPLLELTRGERVAVTLVDRAHEPTAVHWHGIELESYPDGVPGWSGAGARTLAAIAPGDSLTVRFTPPRAGTLMYHSHANEIGQISSGLYGAIVVSEPGAARDAAVDHLVVIADGGPTVDFFAPSPAARVNGSTHPAPLVLAAGRVNRLRLVNIRTEWLTTLTLHEGDAPASWRVVAKDGAPLPPARARDVPAALRFTPGEIYDVEVTPRAGRPLALRWHASPGDPHSSGTLALAVP